ncbi:TrmH family RNA methyltransferase [Saccharicrinis fermentans]|uniref:tRNA (guanosine(18)-2'-O)-methyltransferase n=2 Tax=Saccharicrinis fermentans TaxID=982 RepID=W7XZ07_9BACT|nr:RNA methyltransferase [Saccharicrinis fermentans]GAF03900.1 tRNA (guanosine(18)-2'-O)-methyltransferase [Saccharicrinis fermentans DSM 9555 = JCM 21142]
MREELVQFLSEHVTENRNALFDKVLKDRTKYITVVLEDIYQSHNASAVLRSCDCFGIQDIHVIENRNSLSVSRDVALGSTKWLSMSRYNEEENNTRSALRNLKNEGYRIVATSPHTNDVELYDFDVSKGKAAIVFGTELTGISDVVKEEADEFLRIPMYGFTESFNISVSAALVLQHLAHEIRRKEVEWQLTEPEVLEVKLQWLKRTVKSAELIEREFYRKKI